MKFQFIIFSIFFFSCSIRDKPLKPFLRESNVYVVFESGKEKQLTFNDSDSDPVMLNDVGIVVFVRTETNGMKKRKKIMQVNLQDLKESVITDQKSYKDGNDDTYEILNIRSLTLTEDNKYLLFVTEKSPTSNQLVKVDINTGEWEELFSAESFEQLNEVPYKGYFLVGQSDIEDRGRDVYYRLVSDSGKIIKKFSDLESMKLFKAGLK